MGLKPRLLENGLYHVSWGPRKKYYAFYKDVKCTILHNPFGLALVTENQQSYYIDNCRLNYFQWSRYHTYFVEKEHEKKNIVYDGKDNFIIKDGDLFRTIWLNGDYAYSKYLDRVFYHNPDGPAGFNRQAGEYTYYLNNKRYSGKDWANARGRIIDDKTVNFFKNFLKTIRA